MPSPPTPRPTAILTRMHFAKKKMKLKKGHDSNNYFYPKSNLIYFLHKYIIIKYYDNIHVYKTWIQYTNIFK